MSVSTAPIITKAELDPNPVTVSGSMIIRITVEECTNKRLEAYTHAALSAYTHKQLSSEEL